MGEIPVPFLFNYIRNFIKHYNDKYCLAISKEVIVMADIQRVKSEIKSNLVWLVIYTILGSVCGVVAVLAALKISALVALICAFGSMWSCLSARTCWEDIDSAIDDLEFLITYDMKLELKNE